MSRRIFRILTPLGYHVVPTRDRWRQIVQFKHPALRGHENDVRGCLSGPELARESAKDPAVHLYYSQFGNLFLCVVTAPGDDGDHFVLASYFTNNINSGNQLWKS